jgi:hypothetical protein
LEREQKELVVKLLEDRLYSGELRQHPEAAGRVLGQMGRLKIELGEPKEALVHLSAAQIVLTALNVDDSLKIEEWMFNLQRDVGEKAFEEMLNRTLPRSGLLLAQVLGREQAENLMEKFTQVKAKEWN